MFSLYTYIYINTLYINIKYIKLILSFDLILTRTWQFPTDQMAAWQTFGTWRTDCSANPRQLPLFLGWIYQQDRGLETLNRISMEPNGS